MKPGFGFSFILHSQVYSFFPPMYWLFGCFVYCILFTFSSPSPQIHCHPSPPCYLPKRKKKKKGQDKTRKARVKSKVWCLCTHKTMVKLPVTSPFKKTESFPAHNPARRHQLWRATLQYSCCIFLSFIFLFLLCLLHHVLWSH